MILLVCLAVSVAVGYARRGRLANYLDNPLSGVWLPIAAFALEAAFGRLQGWLPWPPERWLGAAVCLEYALVFAFVFRNRSRRAFWVIAVSSLLNFVVIAANGFRMPVSPVVYEFPQFSGIVERVGQGKVVEYVLVGWDGPLWWLGDTIPVPWIAPGLASVGDIGLAAGVFVLIQEIMCPAKARKTDVRA